MDVRLVAWGRQVKARQAKLPGAKLPGRKPPPLWLFTDHRRLVDPRAAVAALPRGLAGVVFRHDGTPGRVELALQVARICRERRLDLAVSGDWRLAARCRAGLHLRGGRVPTAPRWLPRLTASAHTAADIRRGRLAGAAAVFVSPAFATPSHPAAAGLGPLRWARLARMAPGRAAALGGVDGRSVKRLAQDGVAVGAVSALIG